MAPKPGKSIKPSPPASCNVVEDTSFNGRSFFWKDKCILDIGTSVYIPKQYDDALRTRCRHVQLATRVATQLTGQLPGMIPFPFDIVPIVLDVNIVLWIHGFYVNNETFLFSGDKAIIREQVSKSGKNVILVAPFLGYGDLNDSRNYSANRKLLSSASWGERYLQAVLGKLASSLGYAGPVLLRIQKLIVACHSGGGVGMRSLVDTLGGFRATLSECWGFDCVYGGAKSWYTWKANPDNAKVKLSIVYGWGTANGEKGTLHQSAWLYLMGKGMADENKKILDPPDSKRTVSNLHMLIAHDRPSVADTDTLVDSLMFPPPSGGKRAAKVATVEDAVANLLARHKWPSPTKDDGGDVHYFTTRYFLEFLKNAQL